MLSEKSLNTVKACRFCWMCRHLCPVGLATGKELHNPKSKALLIHMENVGIGQREDYAEDMYACCLCNACASSCETGYEPAVFIRELRAQLAAQGLAPKKVQTVIDRLLKTGSIYEGDVRPEGHVGTPAKGQVLLYPGRTAEVKAPQSVAAAVSVLKKAGVELSVMEDSPCSGAEFYDLIGEVSETKAACEACAAAINASGAETLVVLNPTDARMFTQVYPALGIELKPAVKTLTSYLLELYHGGRLHIRPQAGTVTFHDPCRLARDLEETQPARELLSAMGYELKEMWQSKKLTHCCGGELLSAHSPETAGRIAEDRMGQAAGTGAKLLVTACPGCLANLSAVEGLPVKDICVLLDQATD